METKTGRTATYQVLCVLAVAVGLVSVGVQFVPGWELLAFMLSLAAIGGLVGGRNQYEALERERLDGSYKPAYEWLLLILMVAYAFNALAGWLPVEGVTQAVSGHWPGLMIALVCMLLGLAGFRSLSDKGRPPL